MQSSKVNRRFYSPFGDSVAVLLSLTLIFLNFIIFGSGSHLLSTAGTEVSIPLLQAILIRSITLMGVPLLFIWIGFRFGENHEGLLPPLQAWIFTVINGAIILFIFSALQTALAQD
ncbi:hypothetical protein [Furfurilactobacillus milii]|uniref:Uncharacterized protein n=1 Tax=Furfurilactobacillus milii TaxID=2888272 RepID=A0A6N9I0X6_9LACO|nr:hypothetical protein [Furfurilactobacillus milii]MYV16407.1 hypothetical protein [Furfurilactobacillus milii]